MSGNVQAASDTWDPALNTSGSNGTGTWSNTGQAGSTANWATGGADVQFNTTDTATIGVAGGTGTYTITVNSAGVTANSLNLAPAGTGVYTFGGTGTLALANTGTALTVNNSATFNNNLVLSGQASTLSFATAGQTITLTAAGANSVGDIISGTSPTIAAASALVLSPTTTGTYSGSGANTAITVLIGNTGTIGTNPGITTPTNGVIVNTGATFQTGASTFVGNGTGNGLVTVNGGSFTQAQFLIIGTAQNTGNSGRVVLNSGTMTTNALLFDNAAGSGGSDELDINGGTFANSGGVDLQAWNTSGGQSVLSITGGTATTPWLFFNQNGPGGQAAMGTSSSTLNLSGGTLYIGSGGLVSGGRGTATYAVNISGGTIGATADWGSGMNMSLTNTGTFQAANSSAAAENIVLSGALTGLGGIAKTGAGVLNLTGANNYAGTTTVSAGTLQIGTEASLYNNTPASWTAANITVGSGATLAFNVGGSGQFTTSDVNTLLTNLDGAVTNDGLEAGSTIAFDTTNASTPFIISNAIGNTTGSGGGAVGLTKLGVNTLALTGTNSYTGATTVNGGTLDLGGGTASGSISSSSALVLGNGGGLNYTRTGNTTQTFAGLTLNAGAATISTAAGDTLALGAIARNAGSTVNFVNNTTGTLTTSAVNDANGILGGYATINGTDWAVNNGSNVITALGTYETTTAGGTTAANYTAKNTDVTSSVTMAGVITPNTLRFNTNAAETLTLATGANTLADGGILVTSNVGAFNSTIAGGNLAGSTGGNLIINQNNTSGNLTISSVIANNGAATSLIKSGSGTLVLSGTNSYSGATYLDGGVVTLNNAAGLSTTALSSGIAFDGGTLQYGTATTDYSGVIKNSTGPISVDINGKAITWATALSATNIGGLTVFDTSGLTTGNLTLSGANAFAGNLTIKSGEVTLAAAGASGSGSIILGDVANTGLAATLQSTVGTGFNNPIVVTGNGTDTIINGATNSTTFTGGMTLLNNLTMASTGTGIGILSGPISGAGTLTSTGNLTLANANTYTGGTNLTSGTLSLVNNGSLGSGTLTITGGSLNANSATTTLTLANAINLNAASFGIATLTTGKALVTSGTVTLTGANTLSDTVGNNIGTTLAGGMVFNSGSTFTITGSGGTGATFTFGNGTSASTWSGAATNTVTISTTGSTVTGFDLANGTTVANNIVNNGIAANSLVGIESAGVVNTFTGTLTGSNTAGAFDQTGAGESVISGNISSPGLITISTGTLVLSGNNIGASGGVSFGGNAATLDIGSATALGTGTFTLKNSSTFDNSSGAALSLTTNNAQSWASADTFTGSNSLNLGTGSVTLTANTTLTTGGSMLTVGGNIGGAFVLTKEGTGTLVLTGTNTFSGFALGGSASIGGGTVDVNSATALGTGAITITGTGNSTIDNTSGSPITLTTTGAETWGSSFTFTGSNSLNLGTGAVTLTVTPTVTVSTNTLTVGGAISGAFGLTKAGTGTLVLSGANGYTGATTVNAGVLQVGNGTSGSLASTGTVTMGGGTFYLDGKTGSATSQTIGALTTTAGTASVITLNPNGNTGTLTITSNTLSTGAGSSLNFNLSLGTTNASTSTLGNTVVAWAPTLSNGIINAAYTVTDSGGAGYATVKSGDVVRFTDPGSDGLPLTTGSATGNYFVDQNYSTSSTSTAGSLVEALSGNVLANTVTVDTTGLTSGANLSLGTHTITSTANGGYLFTGANPYAITASTGGGLTSAGAIVFNNYDASAVTISAPILSPATSATFNGTGTTILSGANTYTGATTINGGTVQLGSGGTTGSLATTSTISGTAGTFAIDHSDSVTQGSQFTATGISGAMGLTQMGSGTTTLNAVNTYTGATTVSAGSLVVGSSGSLAAGSSVAINGGSLIAQGTVNGKVAVNNGGTLGGTGTTGAVTLASGGAINLTDGVIGTLTIGGLSTTGGGSLTFEIGTGGTTQIDEIADTGTLSASGSTTINVANLGGVGQTLSTGTYTILSYTGTQQSQGNFSLSTGSLDGKTLTLAQSGDNLEIVVTAGTSGTTYTLSTTAGSSRILTGQSTTLTTTITNTGTGTADTLNYSGLGASGATGSTTAGGPLANNGAGTGTNTVQTFVGSSTGTQTITPTVASATNATLGGSATSTGTTTASVDVVAKRTITNGATTNLGTLHSGATVSTAANAFTSTGANATTTSVSVAGGTGSADGNGVTLTGSSTTYNGATSGTVSGSTQTLGGTIVNSSGGTTTGSFTLGVTTLENGGAGLTGEGSYAPVNVAYSAFVYTGVGVWNTNGGGTWGTVSATPANWTANGGTPGITAGFANTDSASFGTILASGTGSVTLDGDNPSLNAITFNDSAASYVIAQGSGTGSITLDGNGGNANVTDLAGSHTISAPIDLATSANVNVASGQQLTMSGTVSGPGGLVNDGAGTTILSGSNGYSGGTTVSSGTLQLSNSGGSATGSGALNVGAGAVLAGAGSSSGTGFSITGSGGTAATVLVGHNNASDINTTGVMSLQGSGASSIGSAKLVFNLNSNVAGQGNELNVGATAITFNTVGGLNTTMSLNIEGTSFIAGYTAYVLVAGTGTTNMGVTSTPTLTSGQYGGLETFVNSRGQDQIVTGPTSNLQLTFADSTQASFYGAHSYLFLVNNAGVDDIEVEVVPEPGTWVMMLGGLAMLVVWQRRKNIS